MRERITSFASVEYVIVVKNTVTFCDNKTQSFQCDAWNYKDGDKDGDNSKKMARKDSADYQC